MGRKAKVPYELKLASVLEYIKGNKSSLQLANELGVSDWTIMRWVYKYNSHGAKKNHKRIYRLKKNLNYFTAFFV